MNILDLLKADGITPKYKATTKGGEYCSPCPKCGGTDRFLSWPKSGENGRWWCRNCSKGGDTIEYLKFARSMTYHEACAHLKIKPGDRNRLSSSNAGPRNLSKNQNGHILEYPTEAWQVQANIFVKASAKYLLESDLALKYLSSRNIDKNSISISNLGFNSMDQFIDRSLWGLEEELNENGNPKKLWLPQGIVIPCYRNGQLIRLRIRRLENECATNDTKSVYPDMKYYLVPGSSAKASMILGDARFHVVVESEFDAILLDQEAGNLISSIALGSAQNRPDEEIQNILKSSEGVLVALDADKTGGKETWNWWKENFPNARRLVPVRGKDPTEMMQNGVPLITWIEAGLNKEGWLEKALESAVTDSGKIDYDEILPLLLGSDKLFFSISGGLITIESIDGKSIAIEIAAIGDRQVEFLKKVLEGKNEKIFSDAKQAIREFLRLGISGKGRITDLKTMLAILGKREGIEDIRSMGQRNIFDIAEELHEKIHDEGLENVLRIELKCIPVTARMELDGIFFDSSCWEMIRSEISASIENLSRRIEKYLGPVNVNQHKELKAALESKGISVDGTGKDALILLCKEFPVMNDIIQIRKLEHLISFMDGLLGHIDSETGRIHAHYEQIGTGTGRFSCSNPNMQAIPNDSKIRACFKAKPGCKLMSADYSQIELRVLAEISQDEVMRNAFRDGLDLHRLTSSLILKKPYEEVNEIERRNAKAVNFGMIYGMGANGLKKYFLTNFGVEISTEDARSYHANYLANFTGVAKWRENIMKNSHVQESSTLCGRKRYWTEPPSITELLNTPIQGTAADIFKIALVKVAEGLKGTDAKIVACIHDEIVVEVPENAVEKVKDVLLKQMAAAGEMVLRHVKVEVDLKIGSHWS